MESPDQKKQRSRGFVLQTIGALAGIAALLFAVAILGLTVAAKYQQSNSDIRFDIHYEAVRAGAAEWEEQPDGSWGVRWHDCRGASDDP